MSAICLLVLARHHANIRRLLNGEEGSLRSHDMTQPRSQGRHPRRWSRHPIPAGDQGVPKEMLPVVDKPVIQYVVEEAVAAGIRDILVITGRGKRSLEDHFDR